MHYWLAFYWLLLPLPCSIDWRLWPINRAANSACLWLFFFGGSFWCQRLSQSSLCPWQPGSFTGRSSLCSELRQSGRGDEVEGRLREGCQDIVVQYSRSSPRLLMLALCLHGEGMYGVLCVRADGSATHSPTHNRSVWAHTCASMRSNNNNNALLMCYAGPSFTEQQHHMIRQTSLWRVTQWLTYPRMLELSCQIQFQTFSDPSFFPNYILF